MLRRFTLAVALCIAASAAAQDPDNPNPNAGGRNFLGASIGFQQAYYVDDSKTLGQWQFPAGEQIGVSFDHIMSRRRSCSRATFEWPRPRCLAESLALGVSLSYAGTPPTYYGTPFGGAPFECVPACSASGSQTQAMATFHFGAPAALYPVILGGLGVTQFSGSAAVTGSGVAPSVSETFFTGDIGIGVGFTMSRSLSLEFTYEIQGMRPWDTTSGEFTNDPENGTTRIALRYRFR